MKKFMIFKIFILSAFLPVCLQAQNIQLPTVEIKVSQDKVPPVVKAAVLRDFGKGHQPMVWVTPGTSFDTFGWEQTVDVNNMDIYYYSLYTQTTEGSTLYALYTPSGKLVRSKEEVKNFEPPRDILSSLEKSNFKDWRIIKDVHIVKANENGMHKELYDLKLEKGNHRKVVYFDKDGNIVMNKRLLA
jgi:hypothetical protein